jgi:WD40 repeat protein/tRNA A-37 threonylcarbamoyl transferase component Bud32
MAQHSDTSPACGDPVGAPPGAVRTNDAATLAADATTASGAAPAPAQVAGYDILGELGRGGMGVVYKARQHAPNRVVALKMILAAEHAGAAAVARFRNEAEAVARLQHPNIVQVYEVGEHQGRPFFTLEYVDGGGLDKKLDGTPQPPRQAAQLIQTLARAVEAAHAAGVIHRDLKPANVLLTAAGEPRLTDFGLAKQLGSLHGQTESGAILGTPSYMAPEQAAGKGKEVGPATDVYALGAILYECLTGRPPFKAATPLDTILQVIDAEPVPPARLQPQVPRDLETICLKCLEKAPARRYAGAAALAEDLRRFLADEPILARPVGSVERLVKWARRRPAVAALAAAVVLVTAVGFVLVAAALIQVDEQRRQAEAGQAQLRQSNRDLEAAQARQYDAEQAALAKAKAAIKAEKATLYGNYLNGVALAHQLWLANNVTRAREVLAACPREHRDWEWRYLDRVTRAERYTVHGSNEMVADLAFSPDGRFLVTTEVGFAGRLDVRDAATGKELLTLPQRIDRVSFSPDGKRLALAGGRDVLVLDVRSDQPPAQWGSKSYKLKHPVVALQYNAAGRLLAAVATTAVERLDRMQSRLDLDVLDVETEQQVCQLEKVPGELGGVITNVTRPVFSPDGSRLAVALADAIPHVGEKPAPGKEPVPQGKGADNGKPEPAGSPLDVFRVKLRVWDLTQKRLEATHAIAAPADDAEIAFSPDGKRLAWADGSLVRVADLSARREPRTVSARHQDVRGLAFAPGGQLAVAGEDGAVVVWTADGAEEVVLRGHNGPARRLAFSADGSRLATGCGSMFNRTEFKCWDLDAAALARPLRSPVNRYTVCLALHATTGRFVQFGAAPPGAVSPVELSLRDLATNRAVFRRDTDIVPLPPVTFSPDGRQLAVVQTRAVVLIDAATGREQARLPQELPQDGLFPYVQAYHPSGAVLVLGTINPPAGAAASELALHFWDTQTGRPRPSLRGPVAVERAAEVRTLYMLRKLAFSRDGRLLAVPVAQLVWTQERGAVMTTEVQVWDVEAGRVAVALQLPQVVHDLAFTADGRLALAGGTATAAFVEIWDLEKREAVVRCAGHTRSVYCLALSPDGRRLATGGSDQTVKVWDTATGQEVLTLGGFQRAPTVLAFSADGRRLAAGTGMALIDLVSGGVAAQRKMQLPMEVRVWDAGE